MMLAFFLTTQEAVVNFTVAKYTRCTGTWEVVLAVCGSVLQIKNVLNPGINLTIWGMAELKIKVTG